MKTAEQQEDDLLVMTGRLIYCADQKDWKRFEMLLRAFTSQIQSDAIESTIERCAVLVESEPTTNWMHGSQSGRDLYLAGRIRALIPQKEQKT